MEFIAFLQLHSMNWIYCIALHTIHCMHYVPCIIYFYAICYAMILTYALYPLHLMHCILCISASYSSNSMYCIICIVLYDCSIKCTFFTLWCAYCMQCSVSYSTLSISILLCALYPEGQEQTLKLIGHNDRHCHV